MKLIKNCITEMVEKTKCETEIKFCCKKMKQVFNNKYKNSYKDGSGYLCNIWKVDWENMKVKIPIREYESSYYGGISAYENINYCPFCGKPIY